MFSNTHQQNGFVERRHRHIVETTITLMHTVGYLSPFGFMLVHMRFFSLIECLQALGMNSPFFVLYNKHPDITQVKVFRSTVFPYIRPYNHTKIQSRSLLCIFLGYAVGYKGTICYHLPSKKQFLCRHVIHNEIVFPAKNSSCSSSVNTDWNSSS